MEGCPAIAIASINVSELIAGYRVPTFGSRPPVAHPSLMIAHRSPTECPAYEPLSVPPSVRSVPRSGSTPHTVRPLNDIVHPPIRITKMAVILPL